MPLLETQAREREASSGAGALVQGMPSHRKLRVRRHVVVVRARRLQGLRRCDHPHRSSRGDDEQTRGSSISGKLKVEIHATQNLLVEASLAYPMVPWTSELQVELADHVERLNTRVFEKSSSVLSNA